MNQRNVYYIYMYRFLCQGWIYKMLALYNIALVYPYVQHDILMSSMNLQNVYYIKDESTKLLLYVQLHLFILKSNMLFLCPGWIYGKYAISNIILLCPGWICKMIDICNIAIINSYVQSDIFMSRMNLRNVNYNLYV